MQKPLCIVIAGPTAVGKTALAIALAKHFNCSILSADSRQCYKELSIGVARPTKEELAAAPHFFIASHSIQDEITAARYETYALQVTEEVFKKDKILIVVGGTGLYLKAFLEGLDQIPAIDPEIRAGLNQSYEAFGIEWLQQTLSKEDPDYYASGEIQNPQRMLRALEVKRGTGLSIRSFQVQQKAERNFDVVKFCVDMDRELLYERINQRVLNMLEQGLVEEVRSLLPYRHLNALNTVGYAEIFDYLDGSISLDRAVELIQRNTRHYAKRQMTWFRKEGYVFGGREMILEKCGEL
jgi:tRNA dimethylallyltransferase